MENELILFETADKEIKLTVPIKNNTVWLNRKQLAELFGRDVKTIGKHINNALKEELDNSVVANFATTASDGNKTITTNLKKLADSTLTFKSNAILVTGTCNVAKVCCFIYFNIIN